MSNLLFVTLEDVRDREIDLESLIRETAKRCTRDVMHKFRQDIRLVLRQEFIGLTIEPYIGSASLKAWYRESFFTTSRFGATGVDAQRCSMSGPTKTVTIDDADRRPVRWLRS